MLCGLSLPELWLQAACWPGKTVLPLFTSHYPHHFGQKEHQHCYFCLEIWNSWSCMCNAGHTTSNIAVTHMSLSQIWLSPLRWAGAWSCCSSFWSGSAIPVCCAVGDLKSRWKLLLLAKPGEQRGTRCFLHGLPLLSADSSLQFAVLDFFLREARIAQRPRRRSPAY